MVNKIDMGEPRENQLKAKSINQNNGKGVYTLLRSSVVYCYKSPSCNARYYGKLTVT